MIISISACMAGAVCGDHCSPISDTTIMASAGAQCDHVNHVSTQLPYAIVAAVVSFVTYIFAALSRATVPDHRCSTDDGSYVCCENEFRSENGIKEVFLIGKNKKRMWKPGWIFLCNACGSVKEFTVSAEC